MMSNDETLLRFTVSAAQGADALEFALEPETWPVYRAWLRKRYGDGDDETARLMRDDELARELVEKCRDELTALASTGANVAVRRGLIPGEAFQ